MDSLKTLCVLSSVAHGCGYSPAEYSTADKNSDIGFLAAGAGILTGIILLGLCMRTKCVHRTPEVDVAYRMERNLSENSDHYESMSGNPQPGTTSTGGTRGTIGTVSTSSSGYEPMVICKPPNREPSASYMQPQHVYRHEYIDFGAGVYENQRHTESNVYESV